MIFSEIVSFCSGQRGERGLPKSVRYFPVAFLAAIARRRRVRGFYDGRTLALFRAAWLRNRSLSSLVEYALFHRDLGYLLPTRWHQKILKELYNLSTSRRRLVLALFAESVPESIAYVPFNYLAEGADRIAPLAFFEAQRGGKEKRSWLANLHDRQENWRDSFRLLICQHAEEGICVVGNSGSLRGSGWGNKIDEHGLVMRFNQFSGPQSTVEDIGSKMNVWVGAPGFKGPPPKEVDWVVSSGPDMRFRRQNWNAFQERLLADAPVLTVPLSIWCNLVAELSAPPSAGILLLAWLRVISGSWRGLSTVGIGISPDNHVPYHHVFSKQQPFVRHDWGKERFLLGRWRSEGLQSYDCVY